MGDSIRSRIHLPFGTGVQEADLPDGWAIDFVAALGPADLPNPARALSDVLERPIQSEPLRPRLPGSGDIAILLSDQTRKDGKKVFLPVLLDELARCGFRGERVHLIICKGTHRAMSDAELESMLGAELLKTHPVFQHDCDGPVRELGTTSQGTPVAINARLWDYGLLIPVTGVLHHYFAGFGGGRKILVPGVAARRTIVASHRLTFRSPEEGGGRRSGVTAGRLEGNAVAKDLAEAAAMVDLPIFLVALIRGNRPDTFSGFWAGDLFAAHLAACRAYLGWRTYPFARKFDLVLSASGGYPSDGNLVQAHKGLDNAFKLVKPGGRIVHLAACGDGLGGEHVAEWIPVPDLKEFERRLWDDYQIYGQTVYALKEKANQARIRLVSLLPDETVVQLGMQPAADLEEALRDIIPDLPAGHTTAWFPDAGSLLPVHKVKIAKRM